MEKKYRLSNQTMEFSGHTLHRIEHVKKVLFWYVGTGVYGGWVESEKNLSQEGNCWVAQEAKVLGDAVVTGDAFVAGNAMIYDDAYVCDKANVVDNVVVYDGARIAGHASVYGNASVFGCAVLDDHAAVGANAKIFDTARVWGTSFVFGGAQVYGNSVVCGKSRVFENAQVYGNAAVSYGFVRGNAIVKGNAYVKNNDIITGDAVVECNDDFITFKNTWSSGRDFTWTRSNDKWIVGCFYGTGKELIKKAAKDGENVKKGYEAAVKYVEKVKDMHSEFCEDRSFVAKSFYNAL